MRTRVAAVGVALAATASTYAQVLAVAHPAPRHADQRQLVHLQRHRPFSSGWTGLSGYSAVVHARYGWFESNGCKVSGWDQAHYGNIYGGATNGCAVYGWAYARRPHHRAHHRRRGDAGRA